MKLKEILKRQKEIMSPFRYTINYKIIPLWLAACVLPLAAVIPLMIIDEEKYLPVFIAWMVWWVALAAVLLISIPFITKRETQIELERYDYLFKDPKKLETETVIVPDEELTYTLDKDGAYMEFPAEEGEQVFDEAKENVFYIPWERAEVALATQTHLRRVYIALAVFPLDEDAPPFFVPFNEELFAFLKQSGLDKKMDADWTYLLYNPQDAFKQILTKGRILKMRNKKTDKVFVDAQGNFIGDEE